MTSPGFFGFTDGGDLMFVTADGITLAEPVTLERQAEIDADIRARIDALPDASLTIEGFRPFGEEWRP